MDYQTPYRRWAGIGPYYAMFPTQFVETVIEKYTKPGDWILDPFAGRGSSVYFAATHQRSSLGVEINPVGWVYGKTKIRPAEKCSVLARLNQVVELSKNVSTEINQNFETFFQMCYTEEVLRFLWAARNSLDWRSSETDRTLMALILVDLHGIRERSFSNQMRQSRAMAPDYSVSWWKERCLKPPEISPKNFMERKIEWRYAKGVPSSLNGDIILGDSTQILGNLSSRLLDNKIKLLFTSPPYIDLTDYHRDQWLRLWMLGNNLSYRRSEEKYKSSFSSSLDYEVLLTKVFENAVKHMSEKGYVYVRTDARKQTLDITLTILERALPEWNYVLLERPYIKNTQTALYGDKAKKPGEIDIIFSGPEADEVNLN